MTTPSAAGRSGPNAVEQSPHIVDRISEIAWTTLGLKGPGRVGNVVACQNQAFELALEVRPVNGADVDKLIREIYASPPDVVKRASEIER